METGFFLIAVVFGLELLLFVIVLTSHLLSKRKAGPPSWLAWSITVLGVVSLWLMSSYVALQVRGAQQGWDWIADAAVAILAPAATWIIYAIKQRKNLQVH